ncbi:ATP-binding protein, partial [Salmonella enterica]|nr:ATP-binding protein [Salmonella enterica]
LNQISGSLEEIASQKPTILKCLKHKGFQAYLQPFNFITIRAKIESLMEAIETHLSSTGADYKTSLDELERIITETDITIQSSTSFFTKKYATPLLSVIKDTVEAIKDTASEMLCSSIELQRKPPKSAEKKYPLHQVDRLIKIIIPFVNKGPGTAVDVNIEVDTGKESAIIFNNEQFRCGDVPPGNFAICLEANVLAATKKIDIILELNWKEIFGSNKSQIYEIVVEGQNEHVDWNQLENLEPYSLEVAEGDMFVGRDAKVKAIVNKLLKRPMTSTYVTGQKRIGKTSLAKAVINYLEEECKDFHCLYLEYGEYCSATPQKTLKSLGENIYNFMLGFIPGNHQQDPDFSESLADLNLTAKTLESKCPDKKFIIVLDEFDEIHPELYRSGPLAETFFANLRTLAARKNMAFLLVGGEKMPFIIGAQGDQLNKFSRETLDYFSRSSEWAEYIELIRKPVEGYLNWDDAAINKIFNITHGH